MSEKMDVEVIYCDTADPKLEEPLKLTGVTVDDIQAAALAARPKGAPSKERVRIFQHDGVGYRFLSNSAATLRSLRKEGAAGVMKLYWASDLMSFQANSESFVLKCDAQAKKEAEEQEAQLAEADRLAKQKEKDDTAKLLARLRIDTHKKVPYPSGVMRSFYQCEECYPGCEETFSIELADNGQYGWHVHRSSDTGHRTNHSHTISSGEWYFAGNGTETTREKTKYRLHLFQTHETSTHHIPPTWKDKDKLKPVGTPKHCEAEMMVYPFPPEAPTDAERVKPAVVYFKGQTLSESRPYKPPAAKK